MTETLFIAILLMAKALIMTWVFLFGIGFLIPSIREGRDIITFKGLSQIKEVEFFNRNTIPYSEYMWLIIYNYLALCAYSMNYCKRGYELYLEKVPADADIQTSENVVETSTDTDENSSVEKPEEVPTPIVEEVAPETSTDTVTSEEELPVVEESISDEKPVLTQEDVKARMIAFIQPSVDKVGTVDFAVETNGSKISVIGLTAFAGSETNDVSLEVLIGDAKVLVIESPDTMDGIQIIDNDLLALALDSIEADTDLQIKPL